MLPVEIILIAASFPLLGVLALKALGVPRITPTDALAAGFAGTLIVGCLFYDFGRFQYFVPFVACAAVVMAAVYHVRWRSAPNSIGARIDRPLLLAAIVLGLVALLGRLPVSNFIFAIGDAGAYVNSANHLATTGTTIQQFFPLNQVLLGIFSFIGGPALTPYGALVASMFAVCFAVQCGRAYLGGWRGGWLAGLLVGLNVLAMWYGRMPYSESLMLALNLGALGYWKLSSDEAPAQYRYSILFGLFVAAACLNRVTGIVWMLVMSGSLVYLSLRNSNRLRPFIAAFLIAATGYALSIQIALTWGPGYYAMQIHTYLPWLQGVEKVVLFHVAWAALLAIVSAAAVFISHRWKQPRVIGKYSYILTFVCFVGFLFITTVVFKHNHNNWLIVNEALQLLHGKVPQDAYYLINYFTIVSIPLFFIGWYVIFTKHDPIKNESWTLFWLYAALFMMISYVRPTYGMSHDVYMYWDRYFMSDTFVAFMLVIGVGVIGISSVKWLRWLALLFVLAYVAQAVIWIGQNRQNRYLDHGYDMVTWIAHTLPSDNTVLFLDNQYHGKWVFPNVRRTLLVPLAHSYGYATYHHDVQTGPFKPSAFSPDAPPSAKAVDAALDAGRNVYIIAATRLGVPKPPLDGSLPMDVVEARAFLITAKPSIQGRVFADGKRTYPITLTVYRLRPRFVNAAVTAHSGFYNDDIWTNGDGVLKGFDICPSGPNRRLTVNTYGYIPTALTAADIGLQVSVNGVAHTGTWRGRTEYVVPLPNNAPCVQRIELRSSTFVPKQMGLSADTRRLGVDVRSITID